MSCWSNDFDRSRSCRVFTVVRRELLNDERLKSSDSRHSRIQRTMQLQAFCSFRLLNQKTKQFRQQRLSARLQFSFGCELLPDVDDDGGGEKEELLLLREADKGKKPSRGHGTLLPSPTAALLPLPPALVAFGPSAGI